MQRSPLMPHRLFAAFALIALLSGCVNANEIAKKIGAPPENALQLRSLQTRRFSTLDMDALLSSATQTLQDLGYTVTESSPEIGVLVASKQRDATETGQVAGQIMLTMMFALMGSTYTPTWDRDQTINVTLVATPVQNSKQIEIRAAFDRHLTNNHGQLWRAELLMDQEMYREFFERISASAFLEAEAL